MHKASAFSFVCAGAPGLALLLRCHLPLLRQALRRHGSDA